MAKNLSKKFTTMGVVNATPNSFSDGGSLAKKKSVLSFFRKCLDSFDIIDVGAESTAPFNAPIGAKEELERLETFFFPLFDEMEDPKCKLSIDTYRPEVFYECALWLQKVWPKTRLVFNDISGKLDNDLMSLFETDLEFDYIFSHNLSPIRDTASGHASHGSQLTGEAFVRSVSEFFLEGLEKLKGAHKRANIILDPCLGFSKTREQSQSLLRRFGEFERLIPADFEILIGMSRKSFLRFPKELDPKLKRSQEKLDTLQAILSYEILRQAPGRKLVFRTHNSLPFEALADALTIIRP